MILSPIASALCVKHLVASLCCNIEPYPQRLSLSRWPAGEGGGVGVAGKCVWLSIVSIYPFAFPDSYATSSKPSGKKSAVHMALSPLPVHRFPNLCLQPFPPSRCQPCRHVVFHLQRFGLIDVGLVGRKGREGGEQTRLDVGLFSCIQDVCRSRWCGTVTRSQRM